MLWAGGVVARIMVRTMLLRDGYAEFFLFVARPCSTGKHLVAVSDILQAVPS